MVTNKLGYSELKGCDLKVELKDISKRVTGVFPLLCLLTSALSSLLPKNGTFHTRNLPQLHGCPDYCDPHVAPCEVLSGLKHSQKLWR
ncbi:hypothetical protein DV515_00003328 [Chloebia gouldiae]|uniref:Uncharacterized protein n=1 Tax=Chloebia gouldiae TaxID=44316 RepID=A0A3L8SUH2_CHLGU|nr:hypothetical protein DV515_00003328 [Chloebia gouldiae]